MTMNKYWREYIESLLIAIFLALVVRTYVLTGYKVPTISMAPTLIPGDFIFVYKLPYGFKLPFVEKKWGVSPPQVGDVVAFSFPDQPRVQYVKRVAGLEGDRIEIKKGQLYRNGEALIFDFQKTQTQVEQFFGDSSAAGEGEEFGPVVIPKEHAFLIGDNRLVSDDSRYWGTVPFERIEGKVVMTWFSFGDSYLEKNSSENKSNAGFKVRWDRMLKSVH